MFYSGYKNYVLFNVTGNRCAYQMLDVLKKSVEFEQALFAPNVVSHPIEASGKLKYCWRP